MKFNLSSGFRMSSRGIGTNITSNTSFRDPTFTKTSGSGGTGATGEISDGKMNMFMIMTFSMGGTARLNITPEHIKTIKQYNSGKSLYWIGGAACGEVYLQADGIKHVLVPRSGDYSDCGALSPSWLYQLSGNGTKTVQLVGAVGGCNNPGAGLGVCTGAESIPGFDPIIGKEFTIQTYRSSYMSQEVSTFTAVHPCPSDQKFKSKQW